MTTKTDPSVHQESMKMIEEVLYTEYFKLVHKEERGNTYQLGIIGMLNRFYFDQYLKPEWSVTDQYWAEFKQIKNHFLMKMNHLNTE